MANTRSDQKENLLFAERWPVLEETINNIIDAIEGRRPDEYTFEEYRGISTLVQEMCTSNSPVQLPEKLQKRYENTCVDYVSSKVLPPLDGKTGVTFLKELVNQWEKYKALSRRLLRIFWPLDKYLQGRKHVSLRQTSNLVFYSLVYGELNHKVVAAVIIEINRERNHEKINQALVRNAVDIYVEMADYSKKYYKQHFETPMIEDTYKFYYQKALEWATEGTHSVRVNMDRSMKDEENRIIFYLQNWTWGKIPEVVKDAVDRAIAKKSGEEMTKQTDE